MDKLEKVINGIICCMDLDNPDDTCAKCPYYQEQEFGENYCMRGQLMPDAIELLKYMKELLTKKQHDIDKMCEEISKLKHRLNNKDDK